MKKVYVIFLYGDMGSGLNGIGEPIGFVNSHEDFKKYIHNKVENKELALYNDEFPRGEFGADSINIDAIHVGYGNTFTYVCKPIINLID